MRRLFPTLTLLTWALWLGGLVAVLIAVISIAKANPPAADPLVFNNSAPHVFHAFERYQLYLSVAATLFTVLAFAVSRARVHLVLLGLFWAATVAALASTLYITPEIDRMRQANLTHTDEFKSTHGRSMWLYTTEAVALLLAGLLVPLTFKDPAPAQTAPEASPVPGLRV